MTLKCSEPTSRFHPLGPLAVWIEKPSDPPKARVLLVHGMSEHSGRHRNTVAALLAAGYLVVRFDLRGAGKSGGRRQWIERFSDYVDDAARVYQWADRELPRAPWFALGHSLGGAVACHFAAHFSSELHGLVLSAPAFRAGGAISPIKIAVGTVLERFFPTLRLPAGADHGAISRDPAEVEAFRSDALSFHRQTLRMGVQTLAAMARMPEKCALIRCSTLLVHGSHDRLTRMEGSFELLRALPPGDRSMHVIPGGYHEPHNDLGKEDYFALLTRWLDKRCE